MRLKVENGAIAVLPDGGPINGSAGQTLAAQDFGVYAGDQDFFIVGAIVYADAPALGQIARRAPKKIMFEFSGAWMLEAEDLAALRIDAGHDMLDSTVFPRRVHRLKDEENCIAVGCVEKLLLRTQPRDLFGEQLLVFGFRCEVGI